MNETVVGVHPQKIDPVRDGLCDIAVQKLHCPDPDCNQRGSFDQLKSAMSSSVVVPSRAPLVGGAARRIAIVLEYRCRRI